MLRDSVCIAHTTCADISRFFAKPREELLAHNAGHAREFTQRLLQHVENRKGVVLKCLAVAERRDEGGVFFERHVLNVAETGRGLAPYIRVLVVKETHKPVFAPLPAVGAGNVCGRYSRKAVALPG